MELFAARYREYQR